MQLQLQVQPKTEEQLKKILQFYQDQEGFAQNIIAYQIAELKKAILNIRLELQEFERKYQRQTQEFYTLFEDGKLDDNEDFMIWAGSYELLRENERQLQELQ